MTTEGARDRDGLASHITVEELAAYFDGRAAPAARATVIAHLAECRTCRAEANAVRVMLANTPAARGRRWAFAGKALAAGLALALLPRLWSDMRRAPDTMRAPVAVPASGTTLAIAVLFPSDSALVSTPSVEIAWQPVGVDAVYRVTVQDTTGGVVFTTTTPNTTVSLPASLTLPAGQRYFWSIDARLADGRNASSGVRRVSIR